MILEPLTLATITLLYMGVMVMIASRLNRGALAERIATHPIVYMLSLGVVAGSWSFFGAFSLADRYYFGYLSFFVGMGSLFLFSPLLAGPITRICQRFQISSLPDLLEFRYRGAGVGAVVTVALLMAMLPLLALQIRLFGGSVSILAGLETDADRGPPIGLGFALFMALFAIVFGARSIRDKERHNGLVITTAASTAVKTVCFLVLGWLIASAVFDRPSQISDWLELQPHLRAGLEESTRSSSSYMMTLIFVAGCIGLPHLYFMGLYESPDANAMRHTSWGIPLLLLLISVPVLPLLWASKKMGVEVDPAFVAATVATVLQSKLIAALVFVVLLATVSSTMITITLALAACCLNNLALPFLNLSGTKLLRQIRIVRSVTIVLIMLLSYTLSGTLLAQTSMLDTGMISFAATAQFVPAIAALLYWPRANRLGMLAGLSGGFCVWLQLVLNADWILHSPASMLIQDNPWASVVALSLSLNVLLMIIVSLMTEHTSEESEAAKLCNIESVTGRGRRRLTLKSIPEFRVALATELGNELAKRLVDSAVTDIGLEENETRPVALFGLHQHIEAKLSRLVGTATANEISQRCMPFADGSGDPERNSIYQLDRRIDDLGDNLTGFAAEVDHLRRFYRQSLQGLPVGICAVNNDQEIVIWNYALEELTHIPESKALGLRLNQLPPPWNGLLHRFMTSVQPRLHAQPITSNNLRIWVSLHRGEPVIESASESRIRFAVVEDVTENQRLQDELIHTERLASIGRLAAGVAHEIGNPVTAIDSLAQNIKAEASDEYALESANAIIGQTQRIGDIVKTLVGFSHAGEREQRSLVPVEIRAAVAEAIYFATIDRDKKPIQLLNDTAKDKWVLADKQRLLQILLNLINNARDACEANAQVRVSTASEGDKTAIHVIDEGSGISPDVLDKIFDPFFTTKGVGEGTGLGMSLVYTMLMDMNGQIKIHSPCNPVAASGTDVCILLPSVSPS